MEGIISNRRKVKCAFQKDDLSQWIQEFQNKKCIQSNFQKIVGLKFEILHTL
jgi:hypothetical protein